MNDAGLSSSYTDAVDVSGMVPNRWIARDTFPIDDPATIEDPTSSFGVSCANRLAVDHRA